MQLFHEEAIDTERTARATFDALCTRRACAWNHLVKLLGDDALGSSGSESSPAPRPTASGKKGKGKRPASELDNDSADGGPDSVAAS